MMKLPIALQLYSIRDAMEKDPEGALQKVKEFGYDGVEFAGLCGRSHTELKRILQSLGLAAVSAHIPLNELLTDTQKLLSDYRELGCRFVAVPWLEAKLRPGNPGFDTAIQDIQRLGEQVSAMNMTLLYHNHDFEFVKIDGEYGLDILYRTISKEYLQTEIDTCWVKVGGENPVDYVRKHTGRAPIVHLKDFAGQRSENMYKLIGVKNEERQNADFEFRPVGYGIQDIASILEAAEDAGAKWIVVEQDEPSMGKSSLECAQMSIETLKKYK